MRCGWQLGCDELGHLGAAACRSGETEVVGDLRFMALSDPDFTKVGASRWRWTYDENACRVARDGLRGRKRSALRSPASTAFTGRGARGDLTTRSIRCDHYVATTGCIRRRLHRSSAPPGRRCMGPYPGMGPCTAWYPASLAGGQLDWSRCAIDSVSIHAVEGGIRPALIRPIAASMDRRPNWSATVTDCRSR